ncbi:MAG: hypothetical protein HC825_09970 [Oscillatoriales cyanobacterium RM1_1_9]|nr:hypothetical protein [Oscillatoriales cyanobacterium RM1_1_9]
MTLGPADGDIFVRYESQHRESIRKAINLCLSQIQQGNSRETIQQQLEDSTPELEYNPRIFSGTRKSFVHQPIQKKNRLTYSQVSLWFPFYYEVANLMQISQKPNRATYGGFVAENAKC